MKPLYLFLFSILLISCGGSDKTTENLQIPELQGKFKILGVQKQFFKFKEDILVFEKTRMSGNVGCNDFSADFIRNGDKINFSPAIATKMYCEKQMDPEKAILKAIEQAKSLKSMAENEVSFIAADGLEVLRLKKVE